MTSPNPEGTRQAVLLGVSCTSSVLCTATGSTSAGSERSLVERYS
jgi:hypothetical protein